MLLVLLARSSCSICHCVYVCVCGSYPQREIGTHQSIVCVCVCVIHALPGYIEVTLNSVLVV